MYSTCKSTAEKPYWFENDSALFVAFSLCSRLYNTASISTSVVLNLNFLELGFLNGLKENYNNRNKIKTSKSYKFHEEMNK